MDLIQYTRNESFVNAFSYLRKLKIYLSGVENLPYRAILQIPNSILSMQDFELKTTDIISTYHVRRQNRSEDYQITELSLNWLKTAAQRLIEHSVDILLEK